MKSNRMNEWLKICLLLCVFGFLKEIRPSELFLFEYLTGPWKNFTAEQVTQEIYPLATYSDLSHLVVVFLITDLCRYKPLIVLLALSGVVVWSMLIWSKTILEFQIECIFYGTFSATEIAYFTYIYAKVKKEHYQKVTSYTRAAVLAGRAVSGIMSQILISSKLMDYRQLNYITLSVMIMAMFWSIHLPSVQKSIYFHHNSGSDKTETSRFQTAFKLMHYHFTCAFSNNYVVKWSVWWALSSCGFVQVQFYMQPLWNQIVTEKEQHLYNGAVEAVLTFVGFLGALFAGFIKFDWKRRGDFVLSLCSLMQGAILIVNSQTYSVYISYLCYVSFAGLFHFMVTTASTQIAKQIQEDSYGLVFGFNQLVSLALQCIFTLVVVNGDIGFGLRPRKQFLVYGFYHLFIAFLFILIGSVIFVKRSLKR